MEMAAIGYNTLTGLLLIVAMARRKLNGTVYIFFVSVHVLVYVNYSHIL
jgi:hypothetical protein